MTFESFCPVFQVWVEVQLNCFWFSKVFGLSGACCGVSLQAPIPTILESTTVMNISNYLWVFYRQFLWSSNHEKESFIWTKINQATCVWLWFGDVTQVGYDSRWLERKPVMDVDDEPWQERMSNSVWLMVIRMCFYGHIQESWILNIHVSFCFEFSESGCDSLMW